MGLSSLFLPSVDSASVLPFQRPFFRTISFPLRVVLAALRVVLAVRWVVLAAAAVCPCRHR